MLDRLPILIDPLSFSERGKVLSGTIEISELTRLSDELVDSSGLIEVNFSFDKEGKVPVVQGVIKANLKLKCQSCLEELDWRIERKIKLGLVKNLEQADSLASDCEPLIFEDEKILLKDLIEDELILALPDFPRHQENCAKSNAPYKATTSVEEPIKSNNPFAVLAKLKNTGD